MPGQAATGQTDAVRQRGTQGQHADQPGQRCAGPFRYPGDDQLHAQRVDAGQAEPHREAQGKAAGQIVGEQREGGIARSTEQGADGEDAAGRKTVGQPAQREDQGAQDEAELDGIGQRADVGRLDLPAAHQVIGRAVGGKPQRGAEQLGENDGGDGRHGGFRQEVAGLSKQNGVPANIDGTVE